jgi:hypothetical protein
MSLLTTKEFTGSAVLAEKELLCKIMKNFE